QEEDGIRYWSVTGVQTCALPIWRNDPPDRYVFNYRASYAEETAAVVNYLVKVRRQLPEQIAVFAQQDAYGDAGFAGVEKAIRSRSEERRVGKEWRSRGEAGG